MTYRACLVFVLSLTSWSLFASGSKWQQNVHYEVISNTVSETPEVLEFFSYWCPHCFSFEPIVKDIKQQLPPEVNFQRVHVNFMNFSGPEMQDAATRAMIAGRLLGKEEEVNQAIFEHIHVHGEPLAHISHLKTLFNRQNVASDEFDTLVSSFDVTRAHHANNKLLKTYQEDLRRVPTIIVNGKYKAVFSKEMTRKDMVSLVIWLTNLN